MRTYTVVCRNFGSSGTRFLLQHMRHLSVPDNVQEAFEMAQVPGFHAARWAAAAERLCVDLERERAIEMEPPNVMLLVEATEASSKLYTCSPSERAELINDATSIARALRRFAGRRVNPDMGPDKRG